MKSDPIKVVKADARLTIPGVFSFVIPEYIAQSWEQRQLSAPRKITFSRGPRNILIRPFSTLCASSGAVAADVLTKVSYPRHTFPRALIPYFLLSLSCQSKHYASSYRLTEQSPPLLSLSPSPCLFLFLLLSLPVFLSWACFAAQQ